MATPSLSTIEQAACVFRKYGGMMRTSAALRAGIHPRTLYAMRDSGRVEKITRGLYELVDRGATSNSDLRTVATRIPSGVICLVSALAYHKLAPQTPAEIHVALPRTARSPAMQTPPLRVYRFSGKSFTDGIELHDVGGDVARLYSAEKTIADCFKFRNKIGLKTAIGGLRAYWLKGRADAAAIMRFAAITRVTTVIRPYLEAMP